MAAPIVWTTTRDTLVAALASITPDTLPQRLTGDAILARLNAAGAVYDAANTVSVRALMDAEAADYDAALTAWASSTGTAYALADRHARYIESLQVAAQTGRQLDPRVATLADGTRYVLAPLLALPFAAPWDVDGDSGQTGAALVFVDGGAVPVLRVTARAPGMGGRAGNSIEAGVSAAGDGQATHFKLSVRLGHTGSPTDGGYYTETFDNLDTSSASATLGSQAGSLLIATVERVGRGRPANTGGSGYTALSGGTNRLMQSLRDRCGRAVLLSEGGAVERALVTAALAQAEEAWAGMPVLVSRLATQEAGVTAALAEAERMLGFLGWGG